MILRIGFLLLLAAGMATAQGRDVSRRLPAPEQIQKVRAIVGAELWGQMPEWRRRNVVERYQQYAKAPSEVRERIEKHGIKRFLTRPSHRPGKHELPPELARELERLDPKLRRLAGKFAFVRLRQLRFDRNLAMLPHEQRKRWFKRLFPEPFNPYAAKTARLEFEKTVAKAIARHLKPQLKKLNHLSKDEWRTRSLEVVRNYTTKQEQRVLQGVLKQVRRLQGASAEEVSRWISGDAALVLERRNVYATPRQRELIRWALRPETCPLLDFSWMGERPQGKSERRLWSRDVRVLGRISLLSEAGIPKETVLHLASAGSEEDFLRALSGLLGRGGAREPESPVRTAK